MAKYYPATLHQQAVEALWEEASADQLAKIVARPYLKYIAELEAERDRLREALEEFADTETEETLRMWFDQGYKPDHDCSKGTGKNEPQYHTCPGCWFDNLFKQGREALPQEADNG